MRLEMPYDTRKPPLTGRPVTTPKAPIRGKVGTYITPLAAGSPNPVSSPSIKKEQGTVSNATPKVGGGEDISTPVKNFLSSNITPRSGSRRARVDSASSTPRSTPNGTPASSRPTSIIASPKCDGTLEIQGLSLITNTHSMPIRPSPAASSTESPIQARKGVSPERPAQPVNSGANSPMFFYASDAGSAPKRTFQGCVAPKAAFTYADGRPESTTKQVPSSQSSVLPKFYHANGAPESGGVSPKPSTVASPTDAQDYHSWARSSIPSNARQRSTSPLKEFEVPAEHTGTRGRRSSGISSLSLQSGASTSLARYNTPKPIFAQKPKSAVGHSKAQSLTSAPAQKPVTGFTQDTPSLFALQSPQSLSVATPTSPLVSPTNQQSTTSQKKIDELNALAANARRERKVLDLEISNSSLLAINRTLEREMRKQKAELRRYRRLTSSGRLSIAPTERSVSTSTGFSKSYSIGSDIEEEGFEDDDVMTDLPSDEDGFDGTDSSSASLSPGAQASRDARQGARDEKRLRLDLNKHQELLIDSQKLNQSLKRCLDWTEELILEGRKALVYQVRVSDIAVGGRVLHADEEVGTTGAEPGKALLSPTYVYTDEIKSLPWDDTGGTETGMHESEFESSATDMSHVAIMAEEGKEFREYLDSLDRGDT